MSVQGAKGETTTVEPTAAERTVARRAAESRATVPTLEVIAAIEGGARVSTGGLVRACALALREHPYANAAYRDGRFEFYSRVNIGVVLAEAERYVIPTVFDADTKSAAALEDEIEALFQEGAELSSSAFAGATFTVWHAARYGLSAAAIPVVAPQAAALAAGTGSLNLSCDHRILYGARAAAFVQAITHHLERDGV